MKRIMIIMMMMCIFTVCTTFADQKTLETRCVYVIDGDTIVVMDGSKGVKVVLDSIDCPESKQPFGNEATRFVKQTVLNKPVTVNYKATDPYGRLIGIVWIDGVSLNKMLIEKGLAWHYIRFSNDMELSAAEKNARESKTGLWSTSDPQAPWDWRKAHPKPSSTDK